MRHRVIAFFLASALPAFAGGGPENVLVVQNDLCPDSSEVARHYIEARDIPRHHLVHVRIPGGPNKPPKKDNKKDPVPIEDDGWDPRESFASFDEYRQLLESPVRDWIASHPECAITIVALTRGVPVCTPTKNSEGAKIVRATTHMLGGMFVEKDDLRTGPGGHVGVASPFYKADESIDPARPLRQEWKILCAGYLDAFSAEDAKKAIDRSVVSDGRRPEGTIYLGKSAEGDPRGMYNGMFPKLTDALKELGFDKCLTVDHNPGKSLLEGKNAVAMYVFGQANWDQKFPAKNTYEPGCLVDNITSVALTWRCFIDGGGGGQTPMTHFVRAGATVVHGCVREPTTGAWDPEYLHIQRYAAGYNVIESFFMAHPWFPWMNLVAGDPLTQAFAKRPTVKAELTGEKGGYRLKASATATREGAGILSLAVYVDGVKVGDVKESGDFALDPSFDPAVNRWRVVATDDSKFRTQGSASAEPLKKESDRVVVKFDSVYKGAASFKVTFTGKVPVLTWVAPGGKQKTGTLKADRFKIELEDETVPNEVEVWVRTGKSGTDYFRLTVPAKKK